MKNISPTEYKNKNTKFFLLQPYSKEVARFSFSIDVSSSTHDFKNTHLDIFSELLLSGTDKKTREEIEKRIEDLGINIWVFHHQKKITLTVWTTTEILEDALSLMEEIITESLFTPKEIKRISKQVKQNLIEQQEDEKYVTKHLFFKEFFPKTNRFYIESIEESLDLLKTLKRSIFQKIQKEIFQNKWTVTIVGEKKTQEKIIAFIERIHAADLGDNKERKDVLLKSKSKKQRIFSTIKNKANVQLLIGGNLPITLKDDDFIPFYFGLSVLGKKGGFAGRLMSTVREEQGLTYGIYADIGGVSMAHGGVWFITTFFDPQVLEKGIEATLKELRKIVQKGITEKELEKFKILLKNNHNILHESDTQRLMYYHKQLNAGLEKEDIQKQISLIQKLDKKTINNTLKKYIDLENIIIRGAGPV